MMDNMASDTGLTMKLPSIESGRYKIKTLTFKALLGIMLKSALEKEKNCEIISLEEYYAADLLAKDGNPAAAKLIDNAMKTKYRSPNDNTPRTMSSHCYAQGVEFQAYKGKKEAAALFSKWDSHVSSKDIYLLVKGAVEQFMPELTAGPDSDKLRWGNRTFAEKVLWKYYLNFMGSGFNGSGMFYYLALGFECRDAGKAAYYNYPAKEYDNPWMFLTQLHGKETHEILRDYYDDYKK
jgi:hypothetical protein